MKYIALILFFLLMACGYSVSLKKGDSVVTCGPFPPDGIGSDSSAQRERGCIEDFKQQGYIRIP